MDNEKMIDSIRTLCKKNNISPTKLEEKLGFSQGLIGRWKIKTPNLEKIIDIADYFKVSIDEVVGRNNLLNDIFLNRLYDLTYNGLLKWGKADCDKYPKIKIFNRRIDNCSLELYDESMYKETLYVSIFNKGYIIMYAFHKYDKILKPEELKLFIQPTDDSYLIEQYYEQNVLLKLWITILKNLHDESPDEVKAEDLKQQFINQSENLILNRFYEYFQYPSNDKAEVDELINNQELKRTIAEVNVPELQQLIQMFTDPKMVESMETAKRLISYFTEIKNLQQGKDEE